jgi:putative membrane protein
MRSLMRVLLVVFVLLLALATILFVLENRQTVSLLFLGWVGPQIPLSVVLVLTLLTGMMIGPVLGWFLGRRSRRRQKQVLP